MRDAAERPSNRTRPDRDRAGAVLDYVAGIFVALLATTGFALLGDGVRVEMLLLCAAYVALVMALGWRHGWSPKSYARRLRSRPGEPEPPGS